MNKAGTQRIETQRLILRRFKMEDADDMFHNWASDPEVTRYLTWPVHSSVDVTKTVLKEWVPMYEDGGYFNWGMEYKETGEVIGNISVVKLNENTEAADMGYCMSRAYWGRGLMPEALKAVMAFLFDVVGLNRIAACHDVNNPKSGRVMDKAGMKLEGILRRAGKNNLGICDEVWHAMTREDWESRSEPAVECQDDCCLSAITYRVATADDLEELVQSRLEMLRVVNHLGQDFIFSSEFIDSSREYFLHGDQMTVLAMLEEKVVGCASICFMDLMPTFSHPAGKRAHLMNVYTDAAYRRHGIARRMTAMLIEAAWERGATEISLDATDAGRPLYRKCGFRDSDECMVLVRNG